MRLLLPVPCTLFSRPQLCASFFFFYSFVSQTKQKTVQTLHGTAPATWRTLRNAVGRPCECVVACELRAGWVPSSKDGSEIRDVDLDLGVLSWRKWFPLRGWSHSSGRGKYSSSRTPKGSPENPPHTAHAHSALLMFSCDASCRPGRAGGGGVHSFLFFLFFFSLSPLVSFQHK